jgi:hypothetical protein
MLECVLTHLRKTGRQPLLSAHDLASTIIEHCAGVLSLEANHPNPEYGLLEVFGSAIGKVVGVGENYEQEIVLINM